MAVSLARLTVNWTISAGRERASIGVYFRSLLGAPLADLDAAVSAALATWWGVQKPLHTSGVSLTGYRLDLIDIPTGHVTSGLSGVWAASTGTASGTSTPAEVCTVVSLKTALSGGSYRGRVYLPCYASSTMTTEGDLATTQQHTTGDAFATFLDDTNGYGTGDWLAVIYSRKFRSMTPVSEVSVGNIFDVHRSRRRSLVESRYRVAV